jgi:hypothetical protein
LSLIDTDGDAAPFTGSAFNVASDVRLKENIETLVNSGVLLDQLRPVRFSWKQSGAADIGFIAQEVQQVLPMAIDDRPGQPLSMEDKQIVSLLVAEVQHLRRRVAELETR